MEKVLKHHTVKIQVATAIAVIGFILYWTFIFASNFNNLQHATEVAAKTATKNEEMIGQLEAKAQGRDLILVEIRTKLANIETLLIDLKK